MLSRRIRLGFVGMGKMGRIRLEEARRLPIFEVVGFFDPEVCSDVDLPQRFETADELLKHAQLDAVIVSSPNSITTDYVKSALSLGVAVFAEKPPGVCLADVMSVKDLVVSLSDASPCLMYGFNHRLKDGVMDLLEIVDSGRLGKVKWIRGRYGKEMEQEFLNSWRANFALSGGGILIDQGIHLLDLMIRIAGGFDQVSANFSNFFTERPGIEDNVFAIYKSSSTGITASLHSTMAQWRYLFSLEVFLEKGSIVLNGLRTPSGNYGSEHLSVHELSSGKKRTSWEKNYADVRDESWLRELEEFADCVVKRRSPRFGNIGSAIEVMDLLDKTYQSDSDFSRPRG